jgi:segregation and condensation protein A
MSYTFQLPTFEGPLDLLLQLIERAELDITSIALAQVADQYLAHVRALETPDPQALSEFLLLAARLLLIKSRALLPRPAAADAPRDAADEAADELTGQLRAYQRYKQAAALLRSWSEDDRRAFVRLAPAPIPPLPNDRRLDVTLAELVAAVQRRMQLLLPLDDPAATLPLPRRLTLREAAERIRERLSASRWFSFEDLLSLTATRQEVIVTLWAMLELLKRRVITVEQADLFGTISIGCGSDFDAGLAGIEDEDQPV